MARLFTVRVMMSFAALLASIACGPTGTPANCTFTVQLAQHFGMFHGAGVPAAGGDYSVDVIANPTTCQVPTQTPDSCGSRSRRKCRIAAWDSGSQRRPTLDRRGAPAPRSSASRR